MVGGLLGALDPCPPFYGAAALSVLNLLYGWLVLPESLPNRPHAERPAFQFRRLNRNGQTPTKTGNQTAFQSRYLFWEGVAGQNNLFV